MDKKWKTIRDQRQTDLEPEEVRRAVSAEYRAGTKAYRLGEPVCNGNGKPGWQAGWMNAASKAAGKQANTRRRKLSEGIAR